LANALRQLNSTCRSDSSAVEAVEFARAQLVGSLWNLAMDDTPGRREALGSALLPLLPELFRDTNSEVAARACTATFHLVKCHENAALLRKACGPWIEKALPGMLQRLDSDEKRFQALSFVCAMCSLQDDDTAEFHERLGTRIVQDFASTNFFRALMDGEGQLMGGATEQLACVALRLLVQLTGTWRVAAELVRCNFIGEGAVLLELITPRAASPPRQGARAHAIGIIWNLVVAEGGAFRDQVAERALSRLLEVVRTVETDEDELDDTTRERLTMALTYLSHSRAVAARSEWLGAVEALCKLVNSRPTKEHGHGLQILDLLLQAHGQAMATPVMKLLWRRITSEDIAEQVDVVPTFGLFLRLSRIPNAEEWLWQHTGVPDALAGALRRLGESDAGPAHTAKADLVGALWNLGLDDTPPHREELGQALLPLLTADALRHPLLQDEDKVVVCRTAICVFHLSRAPRNLEMLRESIWDVLENGRLNDEACMHLLVVAAEIVQTARHDDSVAGRASFQDLAERALRLFTSRGWIARLSPCEAWPLATAKELAVLLQVSLVGALGSRLLASGLLDPGGCVFEALRPRGQSPLKCPELEARSFSVGIVANLAASKGDSLLKQIADLLLRRLLALAEPHEELDARTSAILVMALCNLCGDKAVVQADCWATSFGSLTALVDKVAQNCAVQVVTCGLQLLKVVLPRQGREQALPVAWRLLSASGCPPEVQAEAQELLGLATA